VIGENCIIGDESTIESNSVLMDNVVIGIGCVINPNVTIYEDCILGDRVILHAGVVIGADGFGYLLYDGKQEKIPQVGNVILEDDVEIGANTSIDRATISSTIIGKGTKIDNLVQIGHNCKIGSHSIICGKKIMNYLKDKEELIKNSYLIYQQRIKSLFSVIITQKKFIIQS